MIHQSTHTKQLLSICQTPISFKTPFLTFFNDGVVVPCLELRCSAHPKHLSAKPRLDHARPHLAELGILGFLKSNFVQSYPIIINWVAMEKFPYLLCDSTSFLDLIASICLTSNYQKLTDISVNARVTFTVKKKTRDRRVLKDE